MAIIYALYDPRDGAVRYVGKCTSLGGRLRSHINERGQTRKCRWIAALKLVGLRPLIVVLEEVNADWQEAERRWIAHHRALGADLCNHTDGGEGLVNASLETRQKLSAIRIAAWNTKREFYLSRLQDPVRCAKISMALTGKPKDPKHVAKLSQNKPGWAHSERAKQRISEALLGNSYAKGSKRTAEYRARQSAAQTGKSIKRGPSSPESNLKRSLATRGRPKSAEWKAKARVAALRRWQRVREAREIGNV